MVALVERMVELNKRKHSGKLAPSELDRLERESPSPTASPYKARGNDPPRLDAPQEVAQDVRREMLKDGPASPVTPRIRGERRRNQDQAGTHEQRSHGIVVSFHTPRVTNWFRGLSS